MARPLALVIHFKKGAFMRALLVVGILAAGAFALSGCGSAKIEQPKTAVEYDPARDGDGMNVVGPGAKKGPKGGMMAKPNGGGGTAVP
jgi:hypothetical protein